MQGKIVSITGANRGIRRETAPASAEKRPTIVMACCDLTKVSSMCAEIKKESGDSLIEVMHLDLASPDAIRKFVNQLHLSKSK